MIRCCGMLPLKHIILASTIPALSTQQCSDQFATSTGRMRTPVDNRAARCRWLMASTIPSFVHGLVTCIMAPVLVARHVIQHGTINPGASNSPADVALLQFSCVRSALLVRLA
jgi:hypothetical protein